MCSIDQMFTGTNPNWDKFNHSELSCLIFLGSPVWGHAPIGKKLSDHKYIDSFTFKYLNLL